MSRKGVYPPFLLQAFGTEILSIASEREKSKIRKSIPSSALKPGQTLTQDVKTANGLLIFAAGTTLSELAILRIQNHARISQITTNINIEEELENDRAA